MPATWTATLWLDDIEAVDHSTEGASQLIFIYADNEKPRIQAFLAAILRQIDSVEQLGMAVLAGRSVYTAVGVQLDTIGKIVGQERAELVDAAYRVMLLGRIFVNLSDGKFEEALELLVNILEVGDDLLAGEYYPCSAYFDVVGAVYGSNIGELMMDWKPAGVRLLWVWNDQLEENCFAMGDTLGADETNITGGFGDLTGATQATGGYISGSQS